MVDTPPDAEPEAPRRDSPLLAVAGLVIAVLATLFSGILEIFLTPLRVAGIPVGVAIPFAMVANVAIAWFAVTTTGRKRAIGVPWLLWTVLMFFAAGAKRSEGDYLINGDDWIALVMILAGSLAFAVFTYRSILRRPLPPRPLSPNSLPSNSQAPHHPDQ
jgi:hypothetical protein